MRPDKLARVAAALRRYGTSPAAGIAAGEITRPDKTAVIDDSGEYTFRELHRRSNALARAFATQGSARATASRSWPQPPRFIEATLALSKLGANALYMNTAFAAPQLAEVVEREGPVALIYDDEFAGLLAGAREGASASSHGATRDRARRRPEPRGPDRRQRRLRPRRPPEESSRFVILTSGTTGTPKGAQRGQPDTLGAARRAVLARSRCRSASRS